MELVILDGVEYVKASAIAKQFNYTADYVGQLCRGKKVDARLVGRTWFVNPKSLIEHRSNKYSKPLDNTESPVVTDDTTRIRVSVEPVLKNKTSKYLDKPVSTEIKKLRVKYERDEENLIPHITKKVILPPKTIRIEQADAKKIRVGGTKTPYSFTTDPIPEVALSGTLKVESIPEPDSLDNVEELPTAGNVIDTNKNIAISSKPENEVLEKEENKAISNSLPKHSSVESDKKPVVNPVRNFPTAPKKFTTITPRQKSTFKPNHEINLQNQVKFTPASLEKLQPVKISTAVLLSPLIATFLALVVVTAIFSASSNVEVSSSSYNSKVVLQVANLIEVLNSK